MTDIQSPYLSNGLMEILMKTINFGSACGAHPFYWNKITLRLEYRQGPRTTILNRLCASFVSLNLVSVLLRTLFTEFDTTLNQLLGTFSCLYLALPVMFYAGLWNHSAAFSRFVNNGVQLLQEFDRHTPNFFTRRQALKNKFLEYALNFTAIGMIFIAICFCAVNIVNPKFVMFISSGMDEPYSLEGLPFLMASVSIMALEGFIYVSMGYLVIFPTFIVSFPMIRAMENLMSSRSSKSHKKQILSRYKQLYLMFVELNAIYGHFLLPATQFFGISFSIFGLVSPFLFTGLLGYAMAYFGGVVYFLMVIIFRYLAEFHIRTEHIIANWKRHLVFQPRDLQAVRTVQIRLSSWGYVDPGIILTQTDIIVNNAIGLLILQSA